MTVVRVEKRKFDGTVRRAFDADRLAAQDEWLIVHHDASRHVSLRDGRPSPIAAHALLYLSTVRPLTVAFHFDADGRLEEAQADAAFPAVDEGEVLAFVDLDLDLIVAPDFTYHARDFDTLEENARTMGYTPEAIAAAGEGLRVARHLVDQRVFPFDGAAERLAGEVLNPGDPGS
jgi:protein associated with RNAse G/E